MSTVISAGILLYKQKALLPPEVFLVQGTNHGMWGIPKGRMEPGEDIFETAQREFREETGSASPETEYHLLPVTKMASGKIIHIYTGDAGDTPIKWDKKKVAINNRVHNGKTVYYRETRAGEWFPLPKALTQIGKGQRVFLTMFSDYYSELTEKISMS